MSGELDPRTGRPFGDHGTAGDAIDFALDGQFVGYDETELFLEAWRDGTAHDEWPEYYEWLKGRAPDQSAELVSELVGELTKARTVLSDNGKMLGLGDVQRSPLIAEIDATLAKAKAGGA